MRRTAADPALPEPGVASPAQAAPSDPERAPGRAVTAAPLLMALAVAAANLVFVPRYAVNWDAVNFLLGIESFDVLHHQPHPPGYIGYVLLGRWVSGLLGDPHLALATMSAVAAGLGTAGTVVLGRRLLPEPWPLVAGALFGSSPLVLYYGRLPLTYAVAAALAVWVAVAAHRAARDADLRALLAGAALLALLGSIRQTDLLMLLPLLVLAAWRFPWRHRVAAAGVLGALTLAWIVPLVWSAGGPGPYLRESAALASYAGGRTNLLGMQLAGLLQNAAFVVVGLVIGLGAAVVLRLGRRRGRRSALARDDRRFLLVWVLPSLLVFLLIHTGQVGYVLLLLPAVILLLVAGAATATQPTPDRVGGGHRLAWLTAGLVAANVVVFLVAPAGVQAVTRQDGGVGSLATAVSGNQGWQDRTRQYDLRANDAYWAGLLDHLEAQDPSTTAVVASLSAGSTFRHLAYYIDDHWLVGLGPDLEGRYRELFVGRGDIDYSVQALEHPGRTVVLPSTITRLVLVGGDLIDAFEDGPFDVEIRDVDGGATIGVVTIPAGQVLEVCDDGDGVPATSGTVVPLGHGCDAV